MRLNLFVIINTSKCTKIVQISRYFWSVFSRIRTEYGSVFSQNAGKYGPEITLYLDTFHAVSKLTANMSQNDTNYIGQLFKFSDKRKLWLELKNEFNVQDQLQFTYNQIINSIPKNIKNIKNLVFQGHHLTKNHEIYCLNKLYSKDI